jgi:hypothetical protein
VKKTGLPFQLMLHRYLFGYRVYKIASRKGYCIAATAATASAGCQIRQVGDIFKTGMGIFFFCFQEQLYTMGQVLPVIISLDFDQLGREKGQAFFQFHRFFS